MPANFTESNRFLFLDTPLGKDTLLLESFTGQEGISQLFSYQLELLSENPKVAFDSILGQKVSFGVNGPSGHDKRFVHGIVSSFTQLPSNLRLARYRAEVVPQFWLFTRRANCRIFQGKSADEILKLVLEGLDVAYELTGSFPKRDYCVQYRETDFAFASRLMEEEGIFYFFKHSASTHKLVIANAPAAHADVPGETHLHYDELAGGGRDEERISHWQKTQEIGAGKYSLRDYDYLAPTQSVRADRTVLPAVQLGKVTHKLQLPANAKLEVYDYPSGIARFHQNGQASLSGELSSAVTTGMQEMDRSQFVISGNSNVHWLTAGCKFILDRHPHADGSYVLTRVVHVATEGGLYSQNFEIPSLYSNSFECLPMALPYRPARETEKPHVWGCQTAVVVGPSGEEIYVDKFSRVKVQFHWDREGKKDANSSCWVRVASFWAGKTWGGIHIPRIGQEVIVDFLEGDPDQPIIIGSVYNAEQMPPWDLPANKTQSGILSRSSPGGGYANANAIRFEDKKGSEQLWIHAEKNQDIEVENDETHWVGKDRTVTVDHDETNHVKHDRTTNIDSNDSETVGQKQTITIGSSQEITIGSSQTITIASSKSETVASSRTSTIASSESVTAGSSISVTAGASISITAGAGVTITSAAPLTITAPMVTLNAAMVSVTGVLQATSLIATAGVVSPVYSPGVGNMI
ncbi:MAG: type VI secretion system tip protein VgrG [Bryobacterales bacterium]|nr:type VI secretion system tip protein VgrG [Bryobacterales bacterium]